MTWGIMQSERAMATRCCWPPESWPGYLCGLLGDADPLEELHGDGVRLLLRHLPDPDRRQRAVLQHGQVREEVERLEHHADLAADHLDVLDVVGELDASTMIRPDWCSSSRLMQRIMVDLPEPDGPQTTIALALPDGQADVLQDMELAEPFVDPLQNHDLDIAAVEATVRLGGGLGHLRNRSL
jgi:hypothetical protein